MKVTDKTGKLVTIKDVDDTNDIMIINKSGITIRLSVKELRVLGRVTQGVRLINIGDKDEIASVAKINYIPGEEETEEGDDTPADSSEDIHLDTPVDETE